MSKTLATPAPAKVKSKQNQTAKLELATKHDIDLVRQELQYDINLTRKEMDLTKQELKHEIDLVRKDVALQIAPL